MNFAAFQTLKLLERSVSHAGYTTSEERVADIDCLGEEWNPVPVWTLRRTDVFSIAGNQTTFRRIDQGKNVFCS